MPRIDRRSFGGMNYTEIQNAFNRMPKNVVADWLKRQMKRAGFSQEEIEEVDSQPKYVIVETAASEIWEPWEKMG